MSENEVVDEKSVSDEENDVIESKSKGQKRKRPFPKATPSKKKSKTEETPPSDKEDESESEDAPVGLLDRSPEVTGTRVRKQVERLNINSSASTESPDRRKNELMPGKGIKLGTSPKILAQLQSVKQSDMVLLHRLLFKRPGTAHEIKKNIREFSGYPFNKEDKEFESRKHMLEKNTLTDLKFICQILCLEKSGTKEGVIERILEFCLCPNPSSKPVAKKNKKATKESKKKTSAKQDGDKSAKSSPKKNITSSETVEDDSSTSDEEGDEENHSSEKEESPKPTPVKKANKNVSTPKPTKEVTTPKATKKAVASKENKEVSATNSKKKPPKKSPKKSEIKIKLPLTNKGKKKSAPIENSDSEEDKKLIDQEVDKTIEDEKSIDKPVDKEKENKKSMKEPSTSPKKSVADNDEKLVNDSPSTVKSPATAKSIEPTNDELANTIKQILKGANLEDMTMKNLCRQVYDKFPECELEKTKKDFIRSTAREILGGES
ncbi:protein DEK-like isoform X2 [Daphnia carinata]|uniref:protein DEK-like isoform X2 n=1 Tax=Daphnia carinata TaxID=120202 RepID=UPI002868711F|nr:protein DEK-like isoform X2 [Daphnia carinata]